MFPNVGRNFCNAFLAGDDPFLAFIEDGKALIESGISALAAIAPVTDWRALTEFEEVKDRAAIAALDITGFAATLVGRPVHIVIGNHDACVSTPGCCRLYLELVAESARQGLSDSVIDFQVLAVPGHFSPEAWHLAGGQYLLKI